MIPQMVQEELQAGAFQTDAQPNSRSLTSEVYRPGDIDANFDNVAYSKGRYSTERRLCFLWTAMCGTQFPLYFTFEDLHIASVRLTTKIGQFDINISLPFNCRGLRPSYVDAHSWKRKLL